MGLILVCSEDLSRTLCATNSYRPNLLFWAKLTETARNCRNTPKLAEILPEVEQRGLPFQFARRYEIFRPFRPERNGIHNNANQYLLPGILLSFWFCISLISSQVSQIMHTDGHGLHSSLSHFPFNLRLSSIFYYLEFRRIVRDIVKIQVYCILVQIVLRIIILTISIVENILLQPQAYSKVSLLYLHSSLSSL